MAQAERTGLTVVTGERFGMLHELLEGQASFADTLFEQGADQSIGQISPLPSHGEVIIMTFGWRMWVVPPISL